MTKLLYKITENNITTITSSWSEAVASERRGAIVVKFFEAVPDNYIDEVRREKILKKLGYK